MAVEWQTSYKIGDAAVDAMQEKLFALTNAFLASVAVQAGAGPVRA